ncbi:MAG: 50S ribosomal protein L5 [Planctomycetaceae bacterium]|jgi:large subunit ribosomal protein L5|nr:50S ribosomal protein L5 [Phycisphaerales bacterium]MCE2652313.1 50S ribosomal protein L5 [Planctomycetaceae bacterium]
MAEEKKNQQSKPTDAEKAEKAAKAKAAAAKAKADAAEKGAKSSKGKSGAPTADQEPRVEPRLQTRFKTHVRQAVAEKFGLGNPMQQPRLDKIVLNVNMGRHLENNKLPPNVKTTVLDTMVKVAGQKPVVTKAKKSVSNFKVREGAETAAMVTLRRDRMWHFLDRFINLACPRIKDFRGLNDKAFDKQGNYACGITEQGVFPEINMAEVTFTHGMNISIGFRNSTPELSKFILAELGMPFRKPEEKKK